jgi:predicted dehydrogenase
MDKKVIKAGLIGYGFAARFHFDALQRVFTEKVEILGTYSRNMENLK